MQLDKISIAILLSNMKPQIFVEPKYLIAR